MPTLRIPDPIQQPPEIVGLVTRREQEIVLRAPLLQDRAEGDLLDNCACFRFRSRWLWNIGGKCGLGPSRSEERFPVRPGRACDFLLHEGAQVRE